MNAENICFLFVRLREKCFYFITHITACYVENTFAANISLERYYNYTLRLRCENKFFVFRPTSNEFILAEIETLARCNSNVKRNRK